MSEPSEPQPVTLSRKEPSGRYEAVGLEERPLWVKPNYSVLFAVVMFATAAGTLLAGGVGYVALRSWLESSLGSLLY